MIEWIRNHVLTGEVLTGMGIVAGIVVCFVEVQRERNRRRDRNPNLRVAIVEEPYKRGTSLLAFKALNVGTIPVYVEKRGIELPDGIQLGFYPCRSSFPIPPLPTTIHPFSEPIVSREWPWQLCRDLVRWGYEGRVKIRAYYQDGSGTIFRSGPYTITLSQPMCIESGPSDIPKHDEEVDRLRRLLARR